MRRPLIAFYVLLTAALELAATAYPFVREGGARLLPALALHAGAVVACVLAARGRRSPERLLPAELDAVVITAAFVPLAGPLLAWVIPRRSAAEGVVDAHAAFLAREVVHGTGGPGRSAFTGRFEEDLARRTDALTYTEVLRSGTVAEKRSAIQHLCRTGEARHLARVRAALADPDDEVRLFAYSELTRIERRFEDDLARLAERVQWDDDQAAVRTEAAVKHLEYARSGVLDDEFARFHLGRAVERSSEAFELGADGPSCARAGLLARVDLGRLSDAVAWLEGFPPAVVTHPAVRTAEAELAFASRDLPRARAIAEELERGREPWIGALCGPAARRAAPSTEPSRGPVA